jgi:hypothetical protein
MGPRKLAAEPLTKRLSQPPLQLLREAAGGPAEQADKLRRLARTLRLATDGAELDRRFELLAARGLAPQRPTRPQLFVGGLDMLRLLLSPAARDYYGTLGISFGFHQLLRVLDDPVSMIDATGLFSDRDTIVGHLLQVVHFNPVYDLQLIQMFPDGLEDLEAQVTAMVAGIHPRQRTIGAIVEDPHYHARLLEYVRRYRERPDATPPIRPESTLRSRPEFARIEECFATLPAFLAYCCRLPTRPRALAAQLLRGELYEPAAGAEVGAPSC